VQESPDSTPKSSFCHPFSGGKLALT
jgi:hypothetical protein